MKVTVTLPLEKETPNALRYRAEDLETPINSLYVRKRALGMLLSWPREITVTIETDVEALG